MRRIVLKLLVTAAGIAVADYFLDGLTTDGVRTLVVAALLLGLANAVVRPILVILTFPITLLTLGLFLLLINGMMVLLVARYVDGFEVTGLGTATAAAIIVGLINWLLAVPDRKRKKTKRNEIVVE